MKKGFALPSVLIISTVMIIVLVSALVTASSMSSTLDEQYYDQLARSATEAGVMRASQCLNENGAMSSWAGKTLRPNTDCRGNIISGKSEYMNREKTHGTTYVVEDLPAQIDQHYVTVKGYAKRFRTVSLSIRDENVYVYKGRLSSEVGANQVAFGYLHSNVSGASGARFGVLRRNGVIQVAGHNNGGQLGLGDTTDRLLPTSIRLPGNAPASAIFMNFLSVGEMTFATDRNGRVYGTGMNNRGQLGIGNSTSPVTNFTAVSLPLLAGEKVQHVTNNSHATYFVTSAGRVFSSGFCTNGALGRGASCPNTTVPVQVALPAGVMATGPVVADGDGAFVRTTTGAVYGWGGNPYGQLAQPTSTASSSTPLKIGTFGDSAGSGARTISYDGRTLYVVTENGGVFAAGDNAHYQISNSWSTSITTLTAMSSAGCSGTAIDAQTDRSHVAILYSDGTVCTAGYNATGQLGRNSTADSLSLGKVSLPAGVVAKAVSVNSIYTLQSGDMNNSFIVDSVGRVFGAGANVFGQLGNGNGLPSRVFVQMQVFGTAEPALYARSGYGTTVIYTRFGRVYTVGNNSNGQLGDGTTIPSRYPKASKYLNFVDPLIF